MESPPPYQPKKKSTGLIIGLIIGGVLLCCGLPVVLLGGAAIWGMKAGGPVVKCTISLKAMQKAVHAYAAEHNGKLPTAATWQDQIKPYYSKAIADPKIAKNPFGFIPVEGEWGCEADDNVVTGLAFNTDLSGKTLADIKDPAGTVLLFESRERKRNLAQKYDAAKLANLPKRFKSEAIFMVTVSGETKMVGPGGKEQDIKIDAGTE